jgi:hypothetical protein
MFGHHDGIAVLVSGVMSAVNGRIMSWPNVVARIPRSANVDLYRAPGCGRRVVIGWIARVRNGYERLKAYDRYDTHAVVHLLAHAKSM